MTMNSSSLFFIVYDLRFFSYISELVWGAAAPLFCLNTNFTDNTNKEVNPRRIHG